MIYSIWGYFQGHHPIFSHDTPKCTPNFGGTSMLLAGLCGTMILKKISPTRVYVPYGTFSVSILAERVGFEPTYRLITDNSISSRARYGLFATFPQTCVVHELSLTGKPFFPVFPILEILELPLPLKSRSEPRHYEAPCPVLSTTCLQPERRNGSADGGIRSFGASSPSQRGSPRLSSISA